MQRQIRAGSAVEGGSAAGAAGARRRGRPWKGGSTAGAAGARRRGRPWQLQQLLVGLTHRLSPVSSDAARTLKRGSCAVTAVTGGEFSGRRLLFSSNPVSPLLSASGDVVPSTTVKHQIVIHYQGGQYSFQGLIRPRIFSWVFMIQTIP